MPDQLLHNLIRARWQVEHYPDFRVWTPRPNRQIPNLYHFCSLGWAAGDYDGPYYDMPKWLRTFIPGGDLTEWWQGRRSRQEVLDLFDAAITYLEMEEVA